jgi:hypothetical protein
MTKPFVSASCRGERCWCGAPAEHKVEEAIPDDEPVAYFELAGSRRPYQRHPLTTYLCHSHFRQIMGPAADDRITVPP